MSAVAPAIPASLTAHISALRTPRNIRTRGVTIAEHDPEIEKTARIAGILRELCEELSNYRGMTYGFYQAIKKFSHIILIKILYRCIWPISSGQTESSVETKMPAVL